jgi:hypothetical protein
LVLIAQCTRSVWIHLFNVNRKIPDSARPSSGDMVS